MKSWNITQIGVSRFSKGNWNIINQTVRKLVFFHLSIRLKWQYKPLKIHQLKTFRQVLLSLSSNLPCTRSVENKRPSRGHWLSSSFLIPWWLLTWACETCGSHQSVTERLAERGVIHLAACQSVIGPARGCGALTPSWHCWSWVLMHRQARELDPYRESQQKARGYG